MLVIFKELLRKALLSFRGWIPLMSSAKFRKEWKGLRFFWVGLVGPDGKLYIFLSRVWRSEGEDSRSLQECRVANLMSERERKPNHVGWAETWTSI